MKVLIGIPDNESDSLLVLDEGQPKIAPYTPGWTEKEFPNYQLLKSHNLKLKDQPVSRSGVFRFRYGPVTSGVREAGSYDLYTYGEKIIRAGIDLSWKHRNIEEAMQGLATEEGVKLAEYVCSNFAFAHSVAYSQAVEQALGLQTSLKTKAWRQLLLEAERIYNHMYVVYKLTSAAAQKVVAAHLHALYEQTLRLNKLLSHSRFLIGFNQVGNMHHLPEVADIREAIAGYQKVGTLFEELYRHSLDNANYLDRLHASGTLSAQQARELGLTGPSLRACGLNNELNGAGEYLIGLLVVTQHKGDALARMETRSEELVNSCQYLADHLKVSDTWNDEAEVHHENRSKNGGGLRYCSCTQRSFGILCTD